MLRVKLHTYKAVDIYYDESTEGFWAKPVTGSDPFTYPTMASMKEAIREERVSTKLNRSLQDQYAVPSTMVSGEVMLYRLTGRVIPPRDGSAARVEAEVESPSDEGGHRAWLLASRLFLVSDRDAQTIEESNDALQAAQLRAIGAMKKAKKLTSRFRSLAARIQLK